MEFDIYDFDQSGSLVFARTKSYTVLPNMVSLSAWLKNKRASVLQHARYDLELPYMKSAIVFHDDLGTYRAPADMLGFMTLSTVLYRVSQSVYMLPSMCKVGGGFSSIITKDLFVECVASFSIQRACYKVSDPVDGQDVVFAPKIWPLPNDVLVSCIIYALFDTKNLTTSVRNRQYKVINHFFPFDHTSFIRDSYSLHLRNVLLRAKPTFVYEWLKQHSEYITGPALEVFNLGKHMYQLFFDSYAHIDLRAINLHSDEASPGWYQIRNGLSGSSVPPFIQQQFKEFMNALHVHQRTLARMIADKAYEYGFLAAPIGS